jgi:hypothetical protein
MPDFFWQISNYRGQFLHLLYVEHLLERVQILREQTSMKILVKKYIKKIFNMKNELYFCCSIKIDSLRQRIFLTERLTYDKFSF